MFVRILLVPCLLSIKEQIDLIVLLLELSDPLWDELIEHNHGIRKDLRYRTSSKLVETTYGSMGRQRHSLLETAVRADQVDAASASVELFTETDEQVQLLQVKNLYKFVPS